MSRADHGSVGSAGPGPSASAAGLTATELNRLRWRCRRGILENDLVLARFLDRRGASLSALEVASLDRLLDLPDDTLWDLLCGRAEPEDGGLVPLLTALRNA